jgi:two-component system, cell cycle sensor histidine kinase and response regulator CckA
MSDGDAPRFGRTAGGVLSMQSRLVDLFEHIQEGVALHEVVCDSQGEPVDYRIIDINPQYEKHTGLARRDVAGKLASVAYGTGTAPYLKEFCSVGMGGPPLRMEVHFQPLQRYFAISVAPIGERAFATIFSDITLFKKQSEDIEKSRLSQRALLDNQPHLAWLKDRGGQFLAVNMAFAKACGQPNPEAVVGKTDFDVWPLELAESYRADDRAVMESGKQKAVEEQIANVDGTRWFETYKSPVFLPDGSIVGTTGVARDITDRKRAEEARLRSERKLGQILDLAPDPIAVTNLDDELTFVNQAFCELIGYQRSEVLGRRTADLGVWGDSGVRAVAREQLSRDGYVEAMESTVVRRDGTRHYVEITATLVEFDEATAIITAGRDVTASRLAEEKARKAAETLSQYFSLSLDLLCIADAEGRFVRLNPAWQEVLGYPLAQLEEGRFFDLVHPEDMESTLATMQRLREGGQILDFQNRYRHADGTWRWIEWRSVPGGHGLVFAAARDVTQRRLDELALREAERTAARSRARLLSVSELAHIGHFTIDFTIGAVDWTPELYRIFGQAQAGFSPTVDGVRTLVHPEDSGLVDAAMRVAMETGEPQRLHFRVLRPMGEVRHCLAIIEVESSAALPAQRVYGLVQDLTELRQAEEKQRKLEQQVMQSQKLESLGVLAGGIAHDFNNLLTSILGNADLAASELSFTNPARPYLDDIEKVSRRAADLCRQMLAYSGKGRFVVQPLSLNEVVREMGHLLSVSISKKVVIKYNFFPDLPAVMADATQMRQVVMNLITNASEAIAEVSGVVTLSTGVMDCDEEYLKGVVGDSEVHPPGQYVFVEVSDTGCGMDADTMGRIFDPFFTTKFTGRGLGLAAVLGIVRGHKGALRVYSEKGRGTTFKILLPAHHQPVPVVEGVNSDTKAWRGQGLILLADDEESVRSMGRRLLERAGFEVVVASDGREALDVFARHREKIRLVILDMTMPHLDGEACYRELRRVDPAVRVIMTSGYNEQDVISRFVGKGLAGFVQKPYKAADLLPMIRKVLGEEP